MNRTRVVPFPSHLPSPHSLSLFGCRQQGGGSSQHFRATALPTLGRVARTVFSKVNTTLVPGTPPLELAGRRGTHKGPLFSLRGAWVAGGEEEHGAAGRAGSPVTRRARQNLGARWLGLPRVGKGAGTFLRHPCKQTPVWFDYKNSTSSFMSQESAIPSRG